MLPDEQKQPIHPHDRNEKKRKRINTREISEHALKLLLLSILLSPDMIHLLSVRNLSSPLQHWQLVKGTLPEFV